MSDDVYEDSIKITDFKQLWDISKNYDLIHSHNEPDFYTVAAMAGGIPVIHDTHDLISLRSPENTQLKYFEGVANRGAAGRIYSTPYQYKEAQDLYGVNGNSVVFYNYASENHLPKKFLPKLSDEDGKIHLVYEGGVSGANGKHRDFADQFVELANLGYMVHIYPASFSDELNNFFKQYPNIIYNKPVSPDTLIEVLTQFDFGIIPWNMEKGNVRFLSSTIANKLFEYLAAGLPVAAADITSYRDFFKKNPVGITFSSIEDFHSKIDNLLKIKSEMKGKKVEFTYENEIEKVEEFYFKILNKQQNEKKEIKFESETRQTNNLNKNENLISSSFKKLEGWIDENGWEGCDPYDIEDFIMTKKKNGELTESDANRVKQYNEVDPLLCREKLKIEKKINAKALGLLLSSYSNLYLVFNEKKYLTKAEEIANWLMKNRSAGYFKFCWGYPFDWQSKIFIPKGTPSVVVSTIVGDGFWKLYQITKKEIYLDVCISICEFINEDLKCDIIDDDKICFSYTPLDNFHVHNANLFAGEFLARIGKEISNSEWIEAGIKTANYAISEQNDDGSIFYWGKIQESFSPKHLDSYHSGFEIRSLINLYSHTGRIEIKVAAEKYLGFYLRNYIQTDGGTRQFALQKNDSQINIHGVAETILLLSSLVKENPELKSTLEKCINWTVNNLQHEEGWFGYMIKDERKIMIPYLRWGEGWMMRGMSEYFASKKIESGEWGYYNQNSSKAGVKANPDKSITTKSKLEGLRKLAQDYLNIDQSFIPTFIIIEIKEITGIESSSKEIIELINNEPQWNNFISGFSLAKQNNSAQNISNKKNYKDYQISMPPTNGLKYGSYEWSEYLYKNSKTDPWGQDWRASQLIRYKKSIELIERNVDKENIKSVLDVGCATGVFLNQLKESLVNAKNFTGIDISKEALKKCKTKYEGFNFINSSLPELKELNAERYDLVSALEVICYVSEDKLNEAALRLKSLINIDGYLLISIYMNQPPFYTPENFKVFLSKYFKIIDEEVRYHKPYYKIELPLRDAMHQIELGYGDFNSDEKNLAEEFLQNSFNLINNIHILEYFNKKAQTSGTNDVISHSIILAKNL